MMPHPGARESHTTQKSELTVSAHNRNRKQNKQKYILPGHNPKAGWRMQSTLTDPVLTRSYIQRSLLATLDNSTRTGNVAYEVVFRADGTLVGSDVGFASITDPRQDDIIVAVLYRTLLLMVTTRGRMDAAARAMAQDAKSGGAGILDSMREMDQAAIQARQYLEV